MLQEQDSALAEALARGPEPLLMPDFWLNEATNVLWPQVRRRILAQEEVGDRKLASQRRNVAVLVDRVARHSMGGRARSGKGINFGWLNRVCSRQSSGRLRLLSTGIPKYVQLYPIEKFLSLTLQDGP